MSISTSSRIYNHYLTIKYNQNCLELLSTNPWPETKNIFRWWLVADRWFSLGRHDINEILLKVASNAIAIALTTLYFADFKHSKHLKSLLSICIKFISFDFRTYLERKDKTIIAIFTFAPVNIRCERWLFVLLILVKLLTITV
jgi:hypothetical protein